MRANIFLSRPRNSQVSHWVSQQSQPIESREELEKRYAEKNDELNSQWDDSTVIMGGL